MLGLQRPGWWEGEANGGWGGEQEPTAGAGLEELLRTRAWAQRLQPLRKVWAGSHIKEAGGTLLWPGSSVSRQPCFKAQLCH